MCCLKEGEDCFCNCGNIVLTGTYISEEDVKEDKVLVNAAIIGDFDSIFLGSTKSIQVSRLSSVDFVKIESGAYELYCNSCGIGFRLILVRDKCYSCFVDNCADKNQKKIYDVCRRSLNNAFPNSLRRFIYEKPSEQSTINIPTVHSEYAPTFHVSQCLNENIQHDAEFEMMFSATNDCFVGSLTDQWLVANEPNFG